MFTSARPIYCVADIRAIEAHHLESATPSLMERAGRAAADLALRLLAQDRRPVLIACGPGNNGGDGFVLARHLLKAGFSVHVLLTGKPDRLPADAAKALAAWFEAGGTCKETLPLTPPEGWGLVVDALFGIGLQRPLEGHLAGLIEQLNRLDAPRLALDIPSGLDADTGRVLGSAFEATHTISFIALKPGLLTLDGPDHCGRITLAALAIDAEAAVAPRGREITPAAFSSRLVRRRRNSHKGSYGDVVIVGGDTGMTGAALLAGRAALHVGAGRVFVCMLAPGAPQLDPLQPELMLRPAEQAPHLGGTVAVGPGLGQSPQAAALLDTLIATAPELILDADALNLVAVRPQLAQRLRARPSPAIITPHPAEAARLLETETASIQSDRLASAQALARRFNCLALLKGCGSLIAIPDGRWWINGSGHPGMATAGMGDVLSGLIAALLAQRWPTEPALIAAAHMHGLAADLLAAEGCGPVGLLAGEISPAARRILNGWLYGHAAHTNIPR